MEISTVEFSSLLTYSPRGNLTEHFRSRTVMRNLKNDEVLQSGVLMSENIARAIKRGLKNYPFKDYFSQNTILIPVPKSSLLKKDMLWVPQRITSALANIDLGRNEECLYRDIPLPKSSTSLASNRPKAFQHYDSMKVRKLLFDPKEILLVDDVITRGATVLGAVNKIADAFPNARIRAFVVMRTISNPEEFSEIVQPCVGTIMLSGENTIRNP